MKKIPVFDILEKIATLMRDNIMPKIREDPAVFEVLYQTQKTHGNIAMCFRDLDEALRVLKSLKNICDDLMHHKHKLTVYNQLGYCYRLIQNFPKAVSCYKKMLQLAWFLNDIDREIEAYNNLCLDYFYLG